MHEATFSCSGVPNNDQLESVIAFDLRAVPERRHASCILFEREGCRKRITRLLSGAPSIFAVVRQPKDPAIEGSDMSETQSTNDNSAIRSFHGRGNTPSYQ